MNQGLDNVPASTNGPTGTAASKSELSKRLSAQWQKIRARMQHKIIGQETLIERILIALLADGHILVEGAPGLAKTRAIKALADNIEASFHRIQFTPDLLPADVTGTEIYRPQSGTFDFQPGPIFHNLILADEINRAPAKVQSALLEAMAEQQVSIGKITHSLPPLFMVMATQNPIEQEGTYPLPEAQLDRFLMHIEIDYPAVEAEQGILKLARAEALSDTQKKRRAGGNTTPPSQPTSQANAQQDTTNSGSTSSSSTSSGSTNHAGLLGQPILFASRQAVLELTMVEEIEEYMVALVMATRKPGAYGKELANAIEYGVSPRGTISLDRCARAHAWLAGRDFVTPEDVQAVAYDVLRHRFTLSFEAEARGVTKNQVIASLINSVAAP